MERRAATSRRTEPAWCSGRSSLYATFSIPSALMGVLGALAVLGLVGLADGLRDDDYYPNIEFSQQPPSRQPLPIATTTSCWPSGVCVALYTIRFSISLFPQAFFSLIRGHWICVARSLRISNTSFTTTQSFLGHLDYELGPCIEL